MSDVTLQDRFTTLEDTLNGELVERRSAITAALLALISRQSLFMFGTPGTAKSMLPARLVAYISDAEYFDILMTRFTEPPELFGPQSLAKLKEDKFERKIDGYLPTAHVAMVDEIFKANSSILNALLWAINERKYRHDATIIKIPLATMFCASNELPTDESLNALYDRLGFKFVVTDIVDNSAFHRMLVTDVPEDPEPLISWADVVQAQTEAAAIGIPNDVADAMVELRKKLRDKGISPTDRKFKQCLSIIRAAAWFDECTEADIEHLRPLEHVLWMDPTQVQSVSETVIAMANPLEEEAMQLLQDLNRLEKDLDKMRTDDEKAVISNEINGKLRRAKGELDELQNRAKRSGKRRRSTRVDEAHDKLQALTERVLRDVFGFDKDEARTMAAQQAEA